MEKKIRDGKNIRRTSSFAHRVNTTTHTPYVGCGGSDSSEACCFNCVHQMDLNLQTLDKWLKEQPLLRDLLIHSTYGKFCVHILVFFRAIARVSFFSSFEPFSSTVGIAFETPSCQRTFWLIHKNTEEGSVVVSGQWLFLQSMQRLCMCYLCGNRYVTKFINLTRNITCRNFAPKVCLFV